MPARQPRVLPDCPERQVAKTSLRAADQFPPPACLGRLQVRRQPAPCAAPATRRTTGGRMEEHSTSSRSCSSSTKVRFLSFSFSLPSLMTTFPRERRHSLMSSHRLHARLATRSAPLRCFVSFVQLPLRRPLTVSLQLPTLPVCGATPRAGDPSRPPSPAFCLEPLAHPAPTSLVLARAHPRHLGMNHSAAIPTARIHPRSDNALCGDVWKTSGAVRGRKDSTSSPRALLVESQVSFCLLLRAGAGALPLPSPCSLMRSST